MKNRLVLIAALLALVLPTPAFAYIGPGAGLSLLGALWALVAAVGMAIFFVVAWPVRKMLRKRRGGESAPEGSRAAAGTSEEMSAPRAEDTPEETSAPREREKQDS
jgi:Na+/melibiose symporter-like transporter